MNNLASAIITASRSNEHIQQAHAWAIKGLEVAEQTRQGLTSKLANPTCDRACAALQFNLGRLYEVDNLSSASLPYSSQMQGELDRAIQHFEIALKRAQHANYVEGVQEANHALLKLRLRLVSKPFRPLLEGNRE